MNAAVQFIEPNSPEWLAARVGQLGGSRIYDATKKLKNGAYSAERRSLMVKMAAERITGRTAESYVSRPMLWGIENEPNAIAAYEWQMSVDVQPVGWVQHPTIEWAGCTPDGGIGAEGLVEFKCPESHTHLEVMLSRDVPAMYYAQCQWQLACQPEREWNDFVSYDPRMPDHLQLVILRVLRDEKAIAELEAEAAKFLDELAEMIGKLSKAA